MVRQVVSPSSVSLSLMGPVPMNGIYLGVKLKWFHRFSASSCWRESFPPCIYLFFALWSSTPLRRHMAHPPWLTNDPRATSRDVTTLTKPCSLTHTSHRSIIRDVVGDYQRLLSQVESGMIPGQRRTNILSGEKIIHCSWKTPFY